MTTKNYTVFVSHSWDYDKQLSNLKSLIEKNSTITIDYSEVTVDAPIDSEDSAYIRRVLKNRITSSDVFLVMAGMYTSYSDWMQWEIETAKKNSIPIIAVKPRGAERIPLIIQNNADVIVGWNSSTIVKNIIEAIENY
ncbi:TPA: TIR domain-containing protein [Yersinia enterocolitica]|uniref:TIR domain-containing protein n=1 Tax=Yersinia TaxID=629 RepID=UPI0005DC5C26|nr:MULTISPECIES: TIR domain-containing protein [Yersinia]EKN3826184.1 TIR domain-containing protein [Yersinia enterocolitica]EKN4826000.1 TIR domain-containing protein [Yersinia enterocolitica]EKN5138869.1 TIR domain-containing protein [Yersinia enterocolitica]EKN5964456.1 TIR domain-containing protein [Yersinia enterocolitica]EKN6144401.1 TIR domain-containing protein [Yersinia enterocolitica]